VGEIFKINQQPKVLFMLPLKKLSDPRVEQDIRAIVTRMLNAEEEAIFELESIVERARQGNVSNDEALALLNIGLLCTPKYQSETSLLMQQAKILSDQLVYHLRDNFMMMSPE
jgi:hypothetical protein